MRSRHPNPNLIPLLLRAVGLLLGMPLTLAAQSSGRFAISWYAINGGAGISGASRYTLSGTIGQFGAGLAGQGRYSFLGGFWGGAFAVQSVSAPTLDVERVGNQVILSWPATATDFVLETTANLAGTVSWSAVPTIPTLVGDQYSVILPASAATQFFRLRRP